MPTVSAADDVVKAQLARACAELERRLRSGEESRAEELLAAFPDLAAHTNAALELIYTEFIVRQDLGQRPVADDWLARFPQWRAELEQVFQVHRYASAQAKGGAAEYQTTPSAAKGAVPLAETDWIQRGHLGAYEILEEIGRGGMGVVYKARQPGLNRLVALKMILAGKHADPADQARLRAEAEAAACLQHPNIVQIHEVGVLDGCPFLSLELVDGGSLDKKLREAPVPARQAAEWVTILARAVHYAHEHGIIHRDLKPANVLLTSAGMPKIADFGLSKRLVEGGPDGTRSGTVLGTPSYMAPEQASGQGRIVGPATDVYALGGILYEIMTGRPPFRAETVMETLVQVQSEEPLAPRHLQPGLPRDLETICLKCLQKEPRKRYPSALHLAEDLGRFLTQEPITARPVGPAERALKWVRRRPGMAVLGAAVLAITSLGLAGILWQWQRAEDKRQQAETALDNAEQERNRAENELYCNLIGRAYVEWKAGNAAKTIQLLDACHPDRRGWEWDYLQGLCHAELLTLRSHHGHPLNLTFSADGQNLVSVSVVRDAPSEVKIWNSLTGQELVSRRHEWSVKSLAFSLDGRCMAVADLDGMMRIMDTRTGEELFPPRRCADLSHGLALDPDGQRLAWGSNKGSLKACDLTTRTEIELAGHKDGFACVAFSRDGKRLASGSVNGMVKIWDVSSGRLVRQNQPLQITSGLSDLWDLAFSPDGQLVVAFGGQILKAWDLRTGAMAFARRYSQNPVERWTFSPDGLHMASADVGGTVRLWDALEGVELATFRGHLGPVASVSFSPDGQRLASASLDKAVKIWDATTDQEATTLHDHDRSLVTSLAFSPNRRYLAAARRTTAVHLWDLASSHAPRSLTGHSKVTNCVAFSSSGRYLASASDDHTIRVWDLENSGPPVILCGHSDGVKCVAFGIRNGYLASGSNDKTIRIWDPLSGQVIGTLSGHTGGISRVAFHPDGQRLASASYDQTVRLWDIQSRNTVLVLGEHSRAVGSVAFSPDGCFLASGDDAGKVRLWNVTPGLSPDQVLSSVRVFHGHPQAVRGLGFSADGRRLISGGLDSTIRIWDTATGQEIMTIRVHPDWVTAVAFSSDGQWLASGSTEVKILKAGIADPEKTAESVRDDEQRSTRWHQREAARAEAARYWFGAAWHLEYLVKAEPENAHYLARRAFVHAAQGNSSEAISELTRAIELVPGNSDPSWWNWLALLHLSRGDTRAYDAINARMLDRLRQTTDPGAANLEVWTCVIAPCATWGNRPVELATKILGKTPQQHFLNTLGAAFYRAGRLEEAIKRLDEANRSDDRGGYVSSWLFLAMAHYRLGHASQAREWLSKAQRHLDQAAREPPTWGTRATPWDERLTDTLLRAEAETLLATKNP
jgi:WD40 repeat protein/tRNA A-37 threonylcarbamoyl transferase component Bud32/Flp pilus assembly protein TadD